MPGGWNPAPYWERARKWREQAEAMSPGKEREACLALAERYANLAAIIERSTDVPHAASAPTLSVAGRCYVLPAPRGDAFRAIPADQVVSTQVESADQ